MTTLDVWQKQLIEKIKNKDADSFKVLLKAFHDSEELLGKFLILMVDVDGLLCSSILATFMSCGKRIMELEQTISTYETALKSEGKVPGQLEFEFKKEVE